MTTTSTNAPPRNTADAETWLRNGSKRARPSGLKGTGRRRSVPHLALGLVLVVACAAAAVFFVMQFSDRQKVLALARPVTVGQALSASDLREVTISVDSGLTVLPAAEAPAVIGQPMAVSLPEGALLTSTELGAAVVPQAGQAITALALKPGQFPPAVAPGAHVLVVLGPNSASGSSPASAGAQDAVALWPAVVTDVAAQANDQVTVISVQLANVAARQVAAQASAALSLVLVSGGGQ